MIQKTSTFKFTPNYSNRFRLGHDEQVTIDAYDSSFIDLIFGELFDD
jgi:hypothetical protein